MPQELADNQRLIVNGWWKLENLRLLACFLINIIVKNEWFQWWKKQWNISSYQPNLRIAMRWKIEKWLKQKKTFVLSRLPIEKAFKLKCMQWICISIYIRPVKMWADYQFVIKIYEQNLITPWILRNLLTFVSLQQHLKWGRDKMTLWNLFNFKNTRIGTIKLENSINEFGLHN